jgi:hypothetical protein
MIAASAATAATSGKEDDQEAIRNTNGTMTGLGKHLFDWIL